LDENPQRERELSRTLIDRRVDGLIVMPASQDHRYVLTEQQAGTSFVFIDRAPSPLLADAVVCDNRGAARDAVQHLLKTGRRTVAYFGDDRVIPTAEDRFLGFRDALAAAGVEPDAELFRHGLRTAERARLAAHELLAIARPNAIFTSQNLVTIGVVQALHELDLQHQIALVGFDDVPLATAVKPGLTVMAQDPVRVGRLAAQRLFDRMNGDNSLPTIYTVATRLLVRGSGELPLST
jgi:LacI family transcriptional regulator